MIDLLIVDDHTVVRDGLKRLFDAVSDMQIAAEAVNGVEALEMLQRGLHFDLILLDLIMPGISGGDLINRIMSMENVPPILILSMHTELQIARRVLRMGVSGFITKGCTSELLLEAVRRVACGGRFIDPLLAEQLADEPAACKGERPHDKLTSRELGILRLIACGNSGNEIAQQLSISNKTVSTHKIRLMQKMGFRSDVDLLRYALDNGLAESSQ